jgi:hypothetical protein
VIKAYLYSFNKEDSASHKWDYGLLKEFFNKYNIEQINVTSIPNEERAFIVIPGPQNIGHEDLISDELDKIGRVVLFITGDESGSFDVDKIKHNNIEIWIQCPHKKHSKYNKIALGTPQHLSKNLPEYQDKSYNVFFAGQITHQRRQQLAKVMPHIENSFYGPTEGFAQGLKPKTYYDKMITSKIVPCPSGQVVIDSFRFYEAIEMLCLPVADGIDSKGNPINYYGYLFEDEIPTVTLEDWHQLPNILPELLNNYPNNMHKIVCWWMKYKRDLGIKLMRQINA